MLALALLLAGCGNREKLVKVNGTATRNGKAVPNLGIHFVPEKGPSSHGRTDPLGQFTLTQSSGQEGVLVGAHKVWVQLPPQPQQKAELLRRAADPDMEDLLQKYGNPQTTPLTVEVKEGQESISVVLD